ncbi:MAG: primosomal protein [Mycobacterium sp.]|nr:primosomal protein [Mycobacterium sp.]
MAPAAARPVARVALDVPLPHLDRPFDYLVTETQDEAAVPGCRVRVRFAGVLHDGFLLERLDRSEHEGTLSPLHAVVSPEPVLPPATLRLCRAVADHWGGTLADVLRLAIPPRHARAEQADPPVGVALPPAVEPLRQLPESLVAGWAAGAGGRAVWQALPGRDWQPELARVAARVAATGGGVLLIVPDAERAARLHALVAAACGGATMLTAAAGPAERYRRWLGVLRGADRVVVGTRAACFAPVQDLALAMVWDDGDDALIEPRAPYPHTRDVLALRSYLEGAGLLIGSLAPSVESLQLVERGWARPVLPERSRVRAAAPRVEASGTDLARERDAGAGARLPTVAWQALREGLRRGPVLVQVPRRGYQPSLACDNCRTPARCRRCAGPLGRPGAGASLRCTWCGTEHTAWACPGCGSDRLRTRVTGGARTSEELGRAFPAIPVVTSSADTPVRTVDATPRIVVATPGLEPEPPEAGYAAVVLADAGVALARPDLRAAEETVRRWCTAASLCAPADRGGRVVVVGESTLPAVQALVRWDPAGFTAREAEERSALGFPPATRMASVEGDAAAVTELLGLARLPAGGTVLGPVPAAVGRGVPADGETPQVRALVRVPRAAGDALAEALKQAAAVRSARKASGSVRVRLDPPDIG